jgi:hypothetical protein
MTPAAFLRTFEATLETMRRVGGNLGVPVVDMYRDFTKNASVYTDSMHFTEEGERMFAELLGEKMPAEFLAPRQATPAK